MSRDRSDPRISITKHAEYMVASASRRRSILRDQKFPPAFKSANYREAFPALVDALVRGGDPRILDEYIAQWTKREPNSRFEAECLALCVDALEAFKPMLSNDLLTDLSFAKGFHSASFSISGVEVSVRPEALVLGPEAGAVKLYLAKTTPLTPDTPGRPGSSSYAATLLHQWAEVQFGGAAPERCIVVDVFAGKIHRAPARYVQRRADQKASFEEIAAVWASIKNTRGESSSAETPF